MAITRPVSSLRQSVRDFGSALSFNGTSDGLVAPLAPAITGWSMGFWIKLPGTTAATEYYVASQDGTGNRNGMSIQHDAASRNVYLQIATASATNFGMDFGNLAEGIFIHLAATWDGVATGRVYVNGVLRNSNTGVSGMTASGNNLAIARWANSNANWGKCVMAHFAMQNTTTPWTQTQIQDLMNKDSVPTGTQLYYTFNSTAADSSGNGNNGTLTGGTYVQDVPVKSRQASTTAPTNALNFNGATADIRVAITNATPLQGLTAVTIEAWVNLGIPVTAYNNRVFEFISGNTGFSLLQVSGGLTTMSAICTNGTTSVTDSSTAVIPLGTWAHVAGTWDGVTVKTWVNGVPSTGTALAAGNTGNPAVNAIIGNSLGFTRSWQGLIQEVRISNIARYTTTFFPQTTPFVSDANTVALFHLDDGSGTAPVDSGPNALTSAMAGTTNPVWSRGYLRKASTTARNTVSIPAVNGYSLFKPGSISDNRMTPATITPLQLGAVNDFTLGCHVYLYQKQSNFANNSDDHCIANCALNFGGNLGYSFYVANNSGALSVLMGNTQSISSAGVFTYGAWHWLFFTLTGTTLTGYIDTATTNVWTQTISGGARKATGGTGGEGFMQEGGGQGSNRSIFGYVKEIISTQTLLSTAQINNIINNGIYPTVDIYYKCNEGQGNVITDYSGNGNNATMTNLVNDWRKTGRTQL